MSDYRNNLYGDEYAIADNYKLYEKVFRNYFYSPFRKLARFLPLGPAFYGLYLGGEIFPNRSDLESTAARLTNKKVYHIKSSQRSILCSFRGRFDYEDQSPFHEERRSILSMTSRQKQAQELSSLFPCAVSASIKKTTFASDLEDYAALLSNSAFVPCPSGNNPETFRHYEVRPSVISYAMIKGKSEICR